VSWWDRWVWSRVQNRDALTLEQLLADETTPTYAGVPVGTDQALRLSAVWACVRLLADAVSTLPLDVYRRGERDPLPELPPLLRQPAAGLSLNEWLYAVMVSLLLRGNAYGIVTGRSGSTLLPAQVDLAHPDRLGVTVTPDGRISYRLNGKELDPADVWHVRAYTFPGAVLGLSPVEYARQTIGLGLAAEKFGAQFLDNAGIPAGVPTSDQHIQQPVADNLKARWKAAHQDKRDIGVLGNGARFQPITVRPDESQFLETSKANVATIARIYGVPPEMIAAESGNSLTYANVEQRGLDFLTYAVRPWLVRLETAISTLLPSTQTVKFNPDALVRVALKDRYEAHKIGIEAGFLTKNEARELEDRPPLPPDQLGGIA
jgi:HK97 family phage portal protein